VEGRTTTNSRWLKKVRSRKKQKRKNCFSKKESKLKKGKQPKGLASYSWAKLCRKIKKCGKALTCKKRKIKTQSAQTQTETEASASSEEKESIAEESPRQESSRQESSRQESESSWGSWSAQGRNESDDWEHLGQKEAEAPSQLASVGEEGGDQSGTHPEANCGLGRDLRGRRREARLGGDQNGDPKSKQVAKENPVILMRDNFYGVDLHSAQEVIVQGENL
jgi:hypothetical protein